MSRFVLMPQRFSRDEAIALLEDFVARFHQGDALDCQFTMTADDEPGMMLVSGRFLIGLSETEEGQMRTIGVPLEVVE